MANIFHFGSVLPTKLAMIVLKNKTCIAMSLVTTLTAKNTCLTSSKENPTSEESLV